MRLAFYQPDIPQNLGAAMRLSACFATPLDIIEPCGFPLTDKALRRSAMDYAGQVDVRRHTGWRAFTEAPERSEGRLILFSTRGAVALTDVRFRKGDTLLFGRESAGAPDDVHEAADVRTVIPLSPSARALNVAMTAGIALHEALRQTDGLPRP